MRPGFSCSSTVPISDPRGITSIATRPTKNSCGSPTAMSRARNAAVATLPADCMRLHICWGNYEGPHTHDIPMAKIIDICFKARPAAFSFEAANPRHEHEWEDLKQTRIPDDKVLIPGVIDSTTNFVEHPRLVAQRICQPLAAEGSRYVRGAGRDLVSRAERLPMLPRDFPRFTTVQRY